MTLDATSRKALIENYLEKSHQAITDAELLLNNGSFVATINRIHYGIFYAISAVSIKHEFYASKHAQLIGWFNKTFVKTEIIERRIGRNIHTAFEQRMESDYSPLANFSKDEINESLANMKEIITAIEKLLVSN